MQESSGNHLLIVSIGSQAEGNPVGWLFGNGSYGAKPMETVVANPLGIKKGFYYGDLMLFILPTGDLMVVEDNDMIMPNKTKYIEAFVRSMISADSISEHFVDDSATGCARDKFRFQWMMVPMAQLTLLEDGEDSSMSSLIGSSGGGNFGGG